jgi:hypothetical protein
MNSSLQLVQWGHVDPEIQREIEARNDASLSSVDLLKTLSDLFPISYEAFMFFHEYRQVFITLKYANQSERKSRALSYSYDYRTDSKRASLALYKAYRTKLGLSENEVAKLFFDAALNQQFIHQGLSRIWPN